MGKGTEKGVYHVDHFMLGGFGCGDFFPFFS